MKVKDFPNWKNVVLNDRVILKVDTNFMSWEQSHDTGKVFVAVYGKSI